MATDAWDANLGVEPDPPKKKAMSNGLALTPGPKAYTLPLKMALEARSLQDEIDLAGTSPCHGNVGGRVPPLSTPPAPKKGGLARFTNIFRGSALRSSNCPI